jgi:hypothetical protein
MEERPLTTTDTDAKSRDRVSPMEPRIYAHCSTLLPVMNAVEAARFAADNGFQGLEVFYNPLDFWPGMIAEATLAELAAIARGEGLGFSLYACSTVNAATGLADLRALNEDTMERMLDICGKIGSTVLCIHPGTIVEFDELERKGVPFHTERFDREELLREGQRRSVEALARWADSESPSWSRTMSTCVTPRRRRPYPLRRWSHRPTARTSRSISTPATPSSAPGCSRNSTCSSRTSVISTSTTTARLRSEITCRSAKGRLISPRLPNSSPGPTPPFPLRHATPGKSGRRPIDHLRSRHHRPGP